MWKQKCENGVKNNKHNRNYSKDNSVQSNKIICVTDFRELWHFILSFLSINYQKNYAKLQGQ